MGAMSPTHWLIVVGVLLLLFGAKKLPVMARSIGQSARVLKGEMKGLRDDEKSAEPPQAAIEADPAPTGTTTPSTTPATGSATDRTVA